MNRHRLVTTLFLTLVCSNTMLLSARASNGGLVELPPPQSAAPLVLVYSKQSGLRIRVDAMWTGNRGYRPATVTITCAKPAPADTQVTMEFFAGAWRQDNQQSIRVEQDFELPQGATSVKATLVVPQYLDWNSYGWKVWVDGREDPTLSLPPSPFNGGNGGSVAVGSLLPRLGKTNPLLIFNSLANGSYDSHNFDMTNLPGRWLGYSTLDVITTSVESLELTRVSQPEKYAELVRWVRAGGNLWVWGLENDYEQLPKLEALLQPKFDPAAEVEQTAINDWHFLEFEDQGRNRLNDWLTLSMQLDKQSKLSLADALRSPIPLQGVDSRDWFVARALGMGTVVALQGTGHTEQPMPAALQQTSLLTNLNWATRHGNDPAGGNRDFNNWLIPDVGAAPVFEFQMLITLFVIAIGPLNYWLLKRRNQLPLLLITVPVAALAATVLLFAYGFLADGISTRVRVRSMAVLDQTVGEVASWARMSYYAGIAPADGIVMPDDTALYPILPAQAEYNSFGRQYVDQPRSLLWTPTTQQLTRGWLASRTPTQYLAVTARSMNESLEFNVQAQPLSVTNGLGTPVIALAVQDHAGNFFLGEDIGVDATVPLTPSNFSAAASHFRQIMTENLPQLPGGYVQPKRYRGQEYTVSMSSSLMELQLEAVVSPVAKGWGNGTYLAVTETGIAVALGGDDVTEASSFHVLRGKW